MPRIEQTALSNLIHNEEYTRKVLPFIKEEYFADRLEGLLFSEIYKFVEKYNSLPTKEALSIEINSNKNVNEDEYKKITDILSTLDKEPVPYHHDSKELRGFPGMELGIFRAAKFSGEGRQGTRASWYESGSSTRPIDANTHQGSGDMSRCTSKNQHTARCWI